MDARATAMRGDHRCRYDTLPIATVEPAAPVSARKASGRATRKGTPREEIIHNGPLAEPSGTSRAHAVPFRHTWQAPGRLETRQAGAGADLA